VNEAFRRFADRAAVWAGSPLFFAVNLVAVAVYLVVGVTSGFSEGLNLVMTTGLTVVTQLLVVLIQATQNRDGRAVHLKLDELLKAVAEARTTVARAEDMPSEELEARIEAIKEERADETGGEDAQR
jgi:low affinity Fe/Cu permease